MRLTKRGEVVVAITYMLVVLSSMAVVGYIE